jgi:hypothetical protein
VSLLGHTSNTVIYMYHLVAFHFHNASSHLSHSSIAMLGHGGMTFAWHDVPLQFCIKCCFLLGGSRTTASFGATICFVCSSHIISSAAHPKYIWVQWNGFKRRASLYGPSTSSRSLRLFPELPLALCPGWPSHSFLAFCGQFRCINPPRVLYFSVYIPLLLRV